jgi:hypothetical protein
MKPRDFVDVAQKEEMIMSTRSKMASLVALAIVIATPAFAGQRTQPTKYESRAGEFGFSVDPAGAQLNLVRRPTNNNLNGTRWDDGEAFARRAAPA